MRNKFIVKAFLGCLILLVGLLPALAGEAFSGKVTQVKSAGLMVVDYGHGQYVVRIVGIDVPKEGPIAAEAKQFLTKMVLGKVVRARFEGRNNEGEMVSRLFIGEPGKEVGIELLKAGLARRQTNYDYKYGELSKAEGQAREARRGLWATAQPR